MLRQCQIFDFEGGFDLKLTDLGVVTVRVESKADHAVRCCAAAPAERQQGEKQQHDDFEYPVKFLYRAFESSCHCMC